MCDKEKKAALEIWGDAGEWDTFIETHPLGSIYHTSGWKIALEENFKNIKAELVTVRNSNSNQLLAGLPLYSIDSFLTGKRLVSIPFALQGAPLVENKDEIKTILDRVIEKVQCGKYSYFEFSSLPSFTGDDKELDLAKSSFYKTHTLSLNGEPADLLSSFHKKAVRTPIKKSLANGLELETARSEADLVEFYRIYSGSRKRLGLPILPIGFFLSLWKHFYPRNHITVLLAKYNNQTVGSNLLLKYKDWVIIEYGADQFDSRHLLVNHFLDWSSIVLASEEGYKKLSFGRTASNHEGLLTYKNRWGTSQESIQSYYYPQIPGSISEGKNNSLQYKFAHNILSLAPDRIYRLLSRFLYNHLG